MESLLFLRRGYIKAKEWNKKKECWVCFELSYYYLGILSYSGGVWFAIAGLSLAIIGLFFSIKKRFFSDLN